MSEIRSVSVHLDADVASYVAKMKLAGAATDQAFKSAGRSVDSNTSALGKTETALGKVDVSTRKVTASSRALGNEVDNTRVKVDTGAKSIDRFSGRLGLIVSGLTAIGPAAIPIVGVAIPAVTALGSNVVSLGLGVGVTELAFHGLGAALTAFNKASLNPTAANITAAQTAMDKLPPSTQQFVLELHRLGPELDKLRQDAAGGLVPGVTAGLHSLLTDAPLVRQAIRGISGELGAMAHETGDALASDQWRPFIRFAGREAPVALHTLGAATGDVAHGLAEIFMAFGPLTGQVDSGILRLAQDFDRWATSLGKTKDFQSFVQYIQANGPKVVSLLGDTAHLFTDIVQAAAPLGGPTVQALDLIVKALDLIASSPLATPLLALGQLYAVTRLVSNGFTGISTGLTGRGGFGARIQSNAKTAVASLFEVTTAQDRARLSTSQLAAVEKERAATNRATLITGGAVAAGLALSASGAADAMGLQNTTMLATAGLIAGPWGAAVGGAIGIGLDWKSSLDADKASAAALQAQVDQLASSGNIQALGKLAGGMQQVSDFASSKGGIFSGIVDKAQGPIEGFDTLSASISRFNEGLTGSKSPVTNLVQLQAVSERMQPAMQKLGLTFDDLLNMPPDQLAGVVDHLVQITEKSDAAVGSSKAVARAFTAMGNDALTTEDRVTGLTSALDALVDPMLNLGSAKDAFRKSLNDFSQDLSKNSKTLRGNSDAAIQNREAVRSRISGLKTTIEAQANTGASAQKMSATLKSGRAAIIAQGQAAGLNAGQIRHMIDVMHLTPKLIQTLIHADTGQALGAVQSVKSALAGIERVVNVHVNVTRNTNALLADVNTPRGADGMTVPGARQPYGDKTLILAAPGEQVVSNRHGQADRFRADMASGRIPRYADGGTVAANTHVTSTPSGPFAAEAGRLTHELKGLHSELHNLTLQSKDLGKAIDAEKQKRDAIVQAEQQLASTVADNFRSQIFGVTPDTSGGIWTSGRMQSTDPARILRQNIRDAREYTRDLRRLRRRGLRGGALAEVDTLDEAQQALGLSRREDHQVSRLFDIRQRASQAAGGVAAQFRFGHQLGRANDHLGHLQDEAHETNQRLHQVEQAIKHHEAEQKKNHEHASAAHAKALQSTAARAARRART